MPNLYVSKSLKILEMAGLLSEENSARYKVMFEACNDSTNLFYVLHGLNTLALLTGEGAPKAIQTIAEHHNLSVFHLAVRALFHLPCRKDVLQMLVSHPKPHVLALTFLRLNELNLTSKGTEQPNCVLAAEYSDIDALEDVLEYIKDDCQVANVAIAQELFNLSIKSSTSGSVKDDLDWFFEELNLITMINHPDIIEIDLDAVMESHRGRVYSCPDENYFFNDQRMCILLPFLAQSNVERVLLQDKSKIRPETIDKLEAILLKNREARLLYTPAINNDQGLQFLCRYVLFRETKKKCI